MKLSELKSKPRHVCMYGEVGSGKTALALTLGERAVVIDLDDGLLTGISLKDSFRNARMSVTVKQFLEPEPQVRATVFSRVKSYIYGIPRDIKSGNFPFEAFIIDSLSAFADSAVQMVMANSGNIGKNPEIQHWGLAFTEIKNVLNVVRTLPIVVVLIAHEQIKLIGKPPNQDMRLELAIPGKNLPSQVARYYDELWYLKTRQVGQGKIQRVLQTSSTEAIAARSRSCLPNLTDTACGMWKLLEMTGYKVPEKETADVIST